MFQREISVNLDQERNCHQMSNRGKGLLFLARSVFPCLAGPALILALAAVPRCVAHASPKVAGLIALSAGFQDREAQGKSEDHHLNAKNTKVSDNLAPTDVRTGSDAPLADRGNPDTSDARRAVRVPLSPKLVRFATARFSHRDKNADGFLSPDEWPEGQTIWPEVDQDRDGRIQLSEYVDWMARYAAGRSIRLRLPTALLAQTLASASTPPDTPSTAGGPGGAGRPSTFDLVPPLDGREARPSAGQTERGVRAGRFYVPPERLPPGLPRWFFDLDVNGDGQISAAEFLAEGGAHRLQEFEQYDRNGDGLLTPDEVLAGPRRSQKSENPQDRPPEENPTPE